VSCLWCIHPLLLYVRTSCSGGSCSIRTDGFVRPNIRVSVRLLWTQLWTFVSKSSGWAAAGLCSVPCELVRDGTGRNENEIRGGMAFFCVHSRNCMSTVFTFHNTQTNRRVVTGLRNKRSLNWPLDFMQPEGSLLLAAQPVTGPWLHQPTVFLKAGFCPENHNTQHDYVYARYILTTRNTTLGVTYIKQNYVYARYILARCNITLSATSSSKTTCMLDTY
jgi:hypothetical protein